MFNSDLKAREEFPAEDSLPDVGSNVKSHSQWRMWEQPAQLGVRTGLLPTQEGTVENKLLQQPPALPPHTLSGTTD